jgi:D-glycero-alpha-D-manno-heptose-7-phosphate kinase
VIISRTPFRLSLMGGGSDFPEYYRSRPGAVVSAALDLHMYVTVNKRFDDSIRVSYTKTQIANHVDDLEHGLIREAMKRTGITKGIEVTTIADLPAGIGLGSSSSLTVGILNALYAYKGMYVSAERLARDACEIEIDVLKSPIGKQDQYIAAFGGFQHIRFNPDDSVSVEPIVCLPWVRERLFKNLLVFYTGVNRDASSVLSEVRQNIQAASSTNDALDSLVALGDDLLRALSCGNPERVGDLLECSWTLKKKMGSKVSNDGLDELYRSARQAGARGGKISGAGGGGCLLLYVDPPGQPAVRECMRRRALREIPVTIDRDGSKIIFAS